ncbi:actin-like protein arp8, partial [Cryomyces antarcticus]
MINQKNYYTSVTLRNLLIVFRIPNPPDPHQRWEPNVIDWDHAHPFSERDPSQDFLKRDDQILALRLQNEENRNRMTKAARDRDRALAHSGQNGLPVTDVDVEMEDDVPAEGEASSEAAGSKVIVIHPGSQNLRLGLASDALPKTVPMVIARKWQESESEEDGSEPRPKRLKLDDGTPVEPEKLFGEEFASHYFALSSELKVHMRNNKRRVLPNQRELCVNYNKRTPPDTISEHNDPLRIDWTELPPNPKDAPAFFTGQAALRIPEKSRPRYKLFWPLRYGWLNERDYASRNLLYQDYLLIIEEAIKNQLGLTRKKDWG